LSWFLKEVEKGKATLFALNWLGDPSGELYF